MSRGGLSLSFARAEGRTGVSAARSGGVAVTALLFVALLVCAVGFAQKLPCWAGGWNLPAFPYNHACYTDIYPLYFAEGLARGDVPYLDHPVEYPVLIGAVMGVTAAVVAPFGDAAVRGTAFYDVNTALLTLCALAAVAATARLVGTRRGATLMLAASPGLALAAFINWDLLAAALTAVAMLAWARERPVAAGVLLGLATATKFYPVLLLGPLFILCLRARRLRSFASALAGTAVAWLVVNLPVYIASPDAWAHFYAFSGQRGADWGSVWYALELVGAGVPGGLGTLNIVGAACFLACCLAIAALGLAAPRRPRLPQLVFLTLAAFLLTNKVWSPQYVIWLLPLVVLVRPRLPAYLTWQTAVVGYFFAIWSYLLGVVQHGHGGLDPTLYATAVFARAGAVLLLAAVVVWNILRPDSDLVRADGTDDPAGGVLDGARDRSAAVPS
ncbi:MAG: glycosyltransferase family 87 protein [Streptosporangiaceae bacterium]